MKRVVNFLLTGVITYCLTMWLLFAIGILLNLNVKAYVVEGMIIASLIALSMACLVWKKIRPAKYEIQYDEKISFVNRMNNRLEELGFQPRSIKQNKFKYRAFIWFSLIDPKINVRLKDNKAIIKGRKEDLDNLLNKLNIGQAA